RIAPANSWAPGDLVLIRLPQEVRSLAAERGYLPANVPLLKTVAAVAPQRVCMQGSQVRIDGGLVARRLRRDRRGCAMATWQACRRLVGDELFLLSTTKPESFDSRYFGPISTEAVLGQAQPLWLESRRRAGRLHVDPPADGMHSACALSDTLPAVT